MDHSLPLDSRSPESAQWFPRGFRNAPTRWLRGRLDEVARVLPEFERRPFALERDGGAAGHENEFLDVIATRGQGDGGWVRRPLAVVSKSYRLIGHRETVGAVAKALESLGIESAGLDTHASLGRYGARLALEINMPANWLFDPGDGFPVILQLRCLNSVDASGTLRLLFTWYRLICTNGMVVGFSEDECRLRHCDSRRQPEMQEEFERGLAMARADRLSMSAWLERKVLPERFAPFADGPLKEAWGARDAARFLHIARTGADAELADRFHPGPPSEKKMIATHLVPGSPPVARTEWDVAQALSWIARGRGDEGSHLDRMIRIPALVAALQERASPGVRARPPSRPLRAEGAPPPPLL
jgi:hypothetical protein